jgi:hypothetical protein
LEHTRQRREPLPYSLGWEFHTEAKGIVLDGRLEERHFNHRLLQPAGKGRKHAALIARR